MYPLLKNNAIHEPWNKGKLVGHKTPLKLQQIWSIRIRLQMRQKSRDLALFNLAIDSKLRGCDLVRLRVSDVSQGGRIQSRAQVIQQKTQRPVQFEITDQTQAAPDAWISLAALLALEYLFPSRLLKKSSCLFQSTQRTKCDFSFAHKINDLQSSILPAHPCTGISLPKNCVFQQAADML